MNMDENQTLEIDALETTLPVKRQRKKKRMADELVNDERDYYLIFADLWKQLHNTFQCFIFKAILCSSFKLCWVQVG
jgi:hypothetical protein